jgi:UDP-glucose 4-epimerase
LAGSKDQDVTTDTRPSVVMTGISGRLGRVVARRLHREYRIVGIDRRPFPGAPKDVELHGVDIRKKRCGAVIRATRPAAVVHMGFLHDPRAGSREHHQFNLGGTTKVLEWCEQFKVPKVVVLSSANVYGPRPDNETFLTEDAPLMAGESFGEIRDLIAADQRCQSFLWQHPEIETVILRPVHIVGPSVRNAPSNFLRLRRPITLMGFDPMVQIIHEEDVARAVHAALAPGVRGVFNIVGPGSLPLNELLRCLGRRPVPLPGFVARPLIDRLWRWHLTSFPAPELDHIRYVCTVDGSRAARAMRFMPALSLADTLAAIDEAASV